MALLSVIAILRQPCQGARVLTLRRCKADSSLGALPLGWSLSAPLPTALWGYYSWRALSGLSLSDRCRQSIGFRLRSIGLRTCFATLLT